MRIIVRQVSGLGNQLFQYAAGRYYAERLGAAMEVLIDTPRNQQSYGFPRPFLLSQYQVERPLREIGVADRLLFAHSPGARQLAPLLRKSFGVTEFSETLDQRYCFLRDLSIDGSVRILYLSGYWQSYETVEAVAATVRREFQLKLPPTGKNLDVLQQIQACATPVSLHIRRGDYTLSAEAMTTLSMDYYRQAIALMRERFENPSFFIFSDDIPFCRENLPVGLDAVFVDHNDSFTSYEDLRLMSCCRHNIIANSSFSWWGAWLNPHGDKVVVAPRNWLSRPGTYYPGLLPPEWILLEA